jgi:membrane protein YdbS with pleckstrin-like domain
MNDGIPLVPPSEPVWRTLHPNSVVAARRGGLTFTALIAGVSLLTGGIALLTGNAPGWVKILVTFAWLAIVGGLTWLSFAIPSRHFRHTRYRVDPLGLLIHRGRLFHSELGVARSRIQHSDVTQGPIQRAYGIATLTIYTAGTEDAQIELSGIAFDEACRLRAELTGQSSDDVV